SASWRPTTQESGLDIATSLLDYYFAVRNTIPKRSYSIRLSGAITCPHQNTLPRDVSSQVNSAERNNSKDFTDTSIKVRIFNERRPDRAEPGKGPQICRGAVARTGCPAGLQPGRGGHGQPGYRADYRPAEAHGFAHDLHPDQARL